MSVRVEKQEFGLREKLNELEFDKLPYHKMPVGTILQVRQSHNTSNLTISSGSYTNLRELTIHPISRNSLMYIRSHCQPRCFVTGNSRARFLNRITRTDTDTNVDTTLLQNSETPQWRNANFAGSGVEICGGSVINEFCDWHRQIKPILYKYQVARSDNNFDMGGHQYTLQVMEIMQ
tara:strand:+ start:2427 stop:2957 length:531 start_codon:yes stop_codon:yes gene_type:complete